jgi:predicted RecA/RadA family phage recombinase
VATNTVTTPLTVQTPATVTAVSLVPSASIVDIGQVFTVTLNLAKSGDAPANVTGARISGVGIACATQPGPVSGIASTQALTWTGCTATVSGILSASATWVDVNVGGTPVATNTVTAPLTALVPARVSATSLVPSASTVIVGQAFSVTLNLSKTGGASANVTGATIDGAGIVCAGAPGPVTDIAATQALTWTGCTATTSGILSAFATWEKANGGGGPTATNTVTAPLTVLTPASVTATGLGTDPPTVIVGTNFSLTLDVTNGGTAPANVTDVALVGVTCTAPAFPVLDILGTRTITWTACNPLVSTALVLIFATVTWEAVNAPGNPVTNVPFIGTIQAQ